MKTVSLLSVLTIALAVIFLPAVANATNYTNTGNGSSYSLNSGDTLRITQGTYTGSISNLPSGAVIIISAGASFKPSSINFWAPAGKMINNGTAVFNGSAGIGGGFTLDNSGNITVNGDLALYDGITKTITNKLNSTITIHGNLTLGTNTVIANIGKITVTGSVSLYSTSTSLNNTGSMNISGSLNNQGALMNENIINITNNLNMWGGSLQNTGAIEEGGTFNISAGMTYTNNCRMITSGAITNNGTLINNGLVWAGTSNSSADALTNFGTIVNASAAKMRMATLTNYATIKGAGYIYATGTTTLGSGATLGITGNTTDTIHFYDVTRTGSQFFDNQWGAVRSNAVFKAFAAPDSFEIFDGCSDVFKKTVNPLPVKWNYFYANIVSQQPVLSWSAEYEDNMKFDIERSYDGNNFKVIGNQVSNNSTSYVFTDKNAELNNTIYYRIKGTSAVDGAVKYTEIRKIRTENMQASVNVYPNPVKDKAVVTYNTNKSEQLIIRIRNASGQQLSMKNVTANTGINRFELNSEITSLKSGLYFLDIISGNEVVASGRMAK